MSLPGIPLVILVRQGRLVRPVLLEAPDPPDSPAPLGFKVRWGPLAVLV